LFPRLGLSSTLTRHENGTFRKRPSNRRDFKTPALSLSIDGKHFENGSFRKRWRHDNHVISLPESRPVLVALRNFSDVVWTGKIFVKTPFSNFSGVVFTGPKQWRSMVLSNLPFTVLIWFYVKPLETLWSNSLEITRSKVSSKLLRENNL